MNFLQLSFNVVPILNFAFNAYYSYYLMLKVTYPMH